MFAAMAGYVVGGKVLKGRESLGAMLGAGLVVIWHIGVDYQLKK